MAGALWQTRIEAASQAVHDHNHDIQERADMAHELLATGQPKRRHSRPSIVSPFVPSWIVVIVALAAFVAVAGLVVGSVALARNLDQHNLSKGDRVDEANGEAGRLGPIPHLTPQEEAVDARYLSFLANVEEGKLQIYRNNTGFTSTSFKMRRAKASEGATDASLPDLRFATRIVNQSAATLQLQGPLALFSTHRPIVTSVTPLGGDGRFNAFAMAGGSVVGNVLANVILVQSNPDGNAQFSNRDADFQGDVNIQVEIMMVRKPIVTTNAIE